MHVAAGLPVLESALICSSGQVLPNLLSGLQPPPHLHTLGNYSSSWIPLFSRFLPPSLLPHPQSGYNLSSLGLCKMRPKLTSHTVSSFSSPSSAPTSLFLMAHSLFLSSLYSPVFFLKVCSTIHPLSPGTSAPWLLPAA